MFAQLLNSSRRGFRQHCIHLFETHSNFITELCLKWISKTCDVLGSFSIDSFRFSLIIRVRDSLGCCVLVGSFDPRASPAPKLQCTSLGLVSLSALTTSLVPCVCVSLCSHYGFLLHGVPGPRTKAKQNSLNVDALRTRVNFCIVSMFLLQRLFQT